MKLQEFLESEWRKDPKGANSVAHLSFLLSTKWSHRRKGKCYRADAQAFIEAKSRQFHQKREEFKTQQAAMEVAKHFFNVFMGKVHMGCPDEQGGFILGLKYDMPEIEKPTKKNPVVIRGMGGNPFVGL